MWRIVNSGMDNCEIQITKETRSLERMTKPSEATLKIFSPRQRASSSSGKAGRIFFTFPFKA